MRCFIEIVAVFLSLAVSSNASEIDSFTSRKRMLDPSFPFATDIVDHIVNGRLVYALNTVYSCDGGELSKAVLDIMGDLHVVGINTMLGLLEEDVNRGRSKYYTSDKGKQLPIPSVTETPKDHILGDFNLIDERAFVSYRFKRFATIKMVDNKDRPLIIGADKLCHFFSQGHELYSFVQKSIAKYKGTTMDPKWVEEMALREVLFFNIGSERGHYGLGIDVPKGATDIYSYADTVANYAGYLFWSKNFSTAHGSTSSPLFVCDANTKKWSQARSFTFRDYVNPGWDESINGVEFRKQDELKKFNHRMQVLFDAGKVPRNQTPMDQSLCAVMGDYYDRSTLQTILNPRCFAALP